MPGELCLSVSDVTIMRGDVAVPVRSIYATAEYDTEGECRAALNDVLERYAVGHECLFRHRGHPVSEVIYEQDVTVWRGQLRFTALPNPGPWRDPPERNDAVLYVGLEAKDDGPPRS